MSDRKLLKDVAAQAVRTWDLDGPARFGRRRAAAEARGDLKEAKRWGLLRDEARRILVRQRRDNWRRIVALAGLILFSLALVGIDLMTGTTQVRWAATIGWIAVIVGGLAGAALVPRQSMTRLLFWISGLALGGTALSLLYQGASYLEDGAWHPLAVGEVLALIGISSADIVVEFDWIEMFGVAARLTDRFLELSLTAALLFAAISAAILAALSLGLGPADERGPPS